MINIINDNNNEVPASGPNNAAAVAFDNTGTGLSSTTAQGAIAELDSSKQAVTDNSLNTTSKTVPGAINELNASLVPTITFVGQTDDPTHYMNAETGSYSNSYYVKMGKLVIINLVIKCIDPNDSGHYYSFDNPLPAIKDNRWASLTSVSTNAEKLLFFNISPNGTFVITGGVANYIYVVHGAYICE